jgi:hypothetical protein
MILKEKRLSIYNPITLGNKYKCWYCGEDGFTNADHFFPKSLGGRIKVRSCIRCNSEKADLTPSGWMDYLRSYIIRLQKNKIKSLDEFCKKEIPRTERMIIATQTLWKRVKWSVKSNYYFPVGTVISKMNTVKTYKRGK